MANVSRSSQSRAVRWSDRGHLGPPDDDLLARRRRALDPTGRGRPPIDLSATNLSRAQLCLPEVPTLSPQAWEYAPDPQGDLGAREALARKYAPRSPHAAPEAFCLLSSTSEGYLWLLHLLCDPGDAILVPTPSYPLLDQIGAQAGVRLERYALRYSGGWDLDLASLPTAEELARRRVRAIVVISPNNPTGSRLGEAEFDALAALELPLIVDEVFRPFALDDGAGFDPLRKEAPLFLLDGLSKRAAAPGLKLGWVLAHGPRSFWAEGIERLSTLADALLATNAFAQRALGQILETEHEVSELVRARLLTNLRLVQEAARGTPVSVLSVQAGFHLILQLPQVWSEEEYLEKLSQMGVWAHPGSLYSLPMGPALVISLLPPPSAVQEGMAAVVQLATSACGLSD